MDAMTEMPPPKPISKTREWVEHQIEKNLGHLREAWVAVAIIAIVACWVGFYISEALNDKASKAKDATVQNLQTRSDNLAKDNERLTKENLEFNKAINVKSSPLKGRVLILAKQLNELAHKNDSTKDSYKCFQEYQSRFEERIEEALRDLDRAGQTSEKMTDRQLISFPLQPSGPYATTNIEMFSQELTRMANNLKD
jgi:hypothetical protein